MADRVVETHCSTLLFVDDLVYKRKKPLDLGFLDFSTPERRWDACRAEGELNARFAPDAYLGVATLTGPGTPWGEPLVVMRRMPEDRRLSTVVATDEDVRPALDALARRLAQVHRTAPAPARLLDVASAAGLAALWESGASTLRARGGPVPSRLVERALQLAHRYLAGRGPLLQARAAAGRVVDGHGDLLADDVFLLEDGPCPLDCLEFDERLRVGDGLLDAAFLAMDLERLRRPDLSRHFLAAYRAAAQDDAPASLEHHYVAYRAQVRAKVACLRAAQSGSEEHARRARSLVELAVRHLEQGEVRLVLVGGLPGSGKTTVARAVATALGGCHLSSDVVRKQQHGLAPKADGAAEPGSGLYSAAATTRTYDALLAQAQQQLEGGRTVVLDATFSDARHREAARALAARTAGALTELCCEVGDDLAVRRLGSRPRGASDASPAVRDWLAARTAPWPEAVPVDTAADPDAAVTDALDAVLGGRFAGV